MQKEILRLEHGRVWSIRHILGFSVLLYKGEAFKWSMQLLSINPSVLFLSFTSKDWHTNLAAKVIRRLFCS